MCRSARRNRPARRRRRRGREAAQQAILAKACECPSGAWLNSRNHAPGPGSVAGRRERARAASLSRSRERRARRSMANARSRRKRKHVARSMVRPGAACGGDNRRPRAEARAVASAADSDDFGPAQRSCDASHALRSADAPHVGVVRPGASAFDGRLRHAVRHAAGRLLAFKLDANARVPREPCAEAPLSACDRRPRETHSDTIPTPRNDDRQAKPLKEWSE